MKPSIIVAIALAGSVSFALACGDGGPAAREKERLKVVVSLPLFADFVQEVGGDNVEVFSLLPPGADPHTFEPTPRDVEKLSQARVVFVNGLGLEAPTMGVIENNKPADAPLIELAKEVVDQGLVSVIEEDKENHEENHEHERNPHLWLDISAAMGYVEIIRDELSGVDPDGAATYRTNAEAYLQELETLGDDLKALAASIPPERRELVTSHDAFPYLARYLGLEVVAFVAASPGQEPSPQDLAQLQQLVDDLDVPAVFVEPQVEAEGRVLQQLAQDIGLEVCTLYSDALDDQVQTYIDMMRFNAAELVRCLGGAGGG